MRNDIFGSLGDDHELHTKLSSRPHGRVRKWLCEDGINEQTQRSRVPKQTRTKRRT